MSGVCAVLAGGLALVTAAESFQLSWTHSVEKVQWQENWRVVGDALLLEQASVMGSGAGMEPPPEARKLGDRWIWNPKISRSELVLAQSTFTSDWLFCVQGSCQPLGELIPSQQSITLVACR